MGSTNCTSTAAPSAAPNQWIPTADLASRAVSTLCVSPLDTHNATLLNNVAPLNWANPEPLPEYDLVAIGAGSGGLVSVKQSARRGAKSALVEKHLAGGDCLNVGCVPSKALIRAARAVKEVRRSAEFGVHHGGKVEVHFAEIMARMRELRAKIAPADSYEGTAAAGAHMFSGTAEFSGPSTVRVMPTDGGAPLELRFKKAVISAGGSPNVPPLYKDVPYLTNETLYNLTALPPRFVVIGGGPIGLEMAQCFAVFGSNVTVIVRGDKLLPKEDVDAAKLVAEGLAADGLQVLTRTAVESAALTGAITKTADGGEFPEMELQCRAADGTPLSVKCEALLVAAGRKPNVHGLGLEAAGVEFDAKTGVKIDDCLRTSNPNIYAVGDVCHQFQFTHMSGEMAKMAVQNALFGDDWAVSSLVVPWCTYTMPEVAHVGAYEHELDKKGVEYDTYSAPIEHNDRAILDSAAVGFVKITCAKGTNRVLGGTAVAEHAGDLVAEITLAIKEDIGIDKLARVIHPYPTLGESVMGAALGYIRGNWEKLGPTA